MYKQDLELSQFFTPREVALFMAHLTAPNDSDMIIDPACGEGVLLNSILEVNPNTKTYGIEIDSNLFARATMNSMDSKIILQNGLINSEEASDFKTGSFDIVIANPPFYGTKNKVVDFNILDQFKVVNLVNSQKGEITEVLFLERFIQLLKPNGKLCTILPEGLMSDKRLSPFRDWLFDQIDIEAIIRLPEKGVFGDAKVNAIILCAKKKPLIKERKSKKTLFVRELKIDELPMLLDFMKRSNILLS